ncbi:MAG TPA: NAD(P)-dependent oxidoreductase [Chloroflexota bacterium]|nr:NAD(P)-dependent oxidoreductase [Chloroflexota bacterium]
MSAQFLIARRPDLSEIWPFVEDRLVARLQALGEVTVCSAEPGTPVHEVADLRDIAGLAWFGGQVGEATIAAAPRLRMIGGVTDNAGFGLPIEQLASREIYLIDATRAWAQSVAEVALVLALSALRRVPRWHGQVAAGEPLWDFPTQQFCDDADFVNGDLGTKRVGVIGLGQIGRRVAQWCVALGASVVGYDPFLSTELIRSWDVQPTTMDSLDETAEVIFVLVPPTPSARHLLSRERIARLRQGALVVVATRAHAVDFAALRERILRNELAGAFDVYDIEPLPVDDPLRNRPNVVHTPHIAGRTRDANLRVADIIADDFARILQGEQPRAALRPEQIAVRVARTDLPI